MSTRLRRTRNLVRVEDRLARAIITLGGIGVVVAVLGICVYLLVTVMPLFQGGNARPAGSAGDGAVVREAGGSIITDEDGLAATVLGGDGIVRTYFLDQGSLVQEASLGSSPAALSEVAPDGVVVGADADGSVWFAQIGFVSALLPASDDPRSDGVVGASGEGGVPRLDPASPRGGFVHLTEGGQVRLTTPTLVRGESIRLEGAPATPRLVAGAAARSGERFLAVLSAPSSAGASAPGVWGFSRTVTPLGGRPREQWSSLAFELPPERASPEHLFLTSDGSSLLAVFADGHCLRLARVGGRVVVAEERSLVADGDRLTAATMLLGGLTLVVGDDRGIVHGFFAARDPLAGTPDSMRLVEGHRFGVTEAAVRSLVSASRDRLVLAADDQGHATLVHMTSHKRVANVTSPGGAPWGVALSPRGDRILLAGAGGRVDLWDVTLGHPKASTHALFGRPLYEGSLEGSYVYQSSAGSDQAELKNSLVPLLFGTLKATVFATIIAIPLAVLAAIYTSEFLSPRTRRTVKPVIELMASLPSVVLGFVASMVVAPLLAAWLPEVLACLITVPLAVLLGAHLWQLAPARFASRTRGGRQMALVALWAALGVGAGVVGAPVLESALFVPSRGDALVRAGSFERVPQSDVPPWIGARQQLSPGEHRELRREGLAFRGGQVVRPVEPQGERQAEVERIIVDNKLDKADLRAWLDGAMGGPWPGWAVVCFPPAMVATWVLVHAATRRRFASLQGGLALADVVRFGAIAAGAVALASLAAWGLVLVGLDPRDSILGPFSVRNSLVVGLIMGFAIIPIIYTISEDAMRGVPGGLRLASLGAGATPWQTAVRVVLPVAASGIFSACMIGLGRAVGETMIVLMATGNSPEMSWNMFSGFRTLAANIAVELPESDKGSTHYRLLFLCGLLLFGLTFAINTTAEVVRQYFRRRNANL